MHKGWLIVEKVVWDFAVASFGSIMRLFVYLKCSFFVLFFFFVFFCEKGHAKSIPTPINLRLKY